MVNNKKNWLKMIFSIQCWTLGSDLHQTKENITINNWLKNQTKILKHSEANNGLVFSLIKTLIDASWHRSKKIIAIYLWHLIPHELTLMSYFIKDPWRAL